MPRVSISKDQAFDLRLKGYEVRRVVVNYGKTPIYDVACEESIVIPDIPEARERPYITERLLACASQLSW